jgi:hypothetical protein
MQQPLQLAPGALQQQGQMLMGNTVAQPWTGGYAMQAPVQQQQQYWQEKSMQQQQQQPQQQQQLQVPPMWGPSGQMRLAAEQAFLSDNPANRRHSASMRSKRVQLQSVDESQPQEQRQRRPQQQQQQGAAEGTRSLAVTTASLQPADVKLS